MTNEFAAFVGLRHFLYLISWQENKGFFIPLKGQHQRVTLHQYFESVSYRFCKKNSCDDSNNTFGYPRVKIDFWKFILVPNSHFNDFRCPLKQKLLSGLLIVWTTQMLVKIKNWHPMMAFGDSQPTSAAILHSGGLYWQHCTG